MNVFQTQDLSVYQLALAAQSSVQPSPVSPATLLSLMRSQIDLLITQNITATLWVKLPPGKIWYSEIHRYYQQPNICCVIFTCNVEESEKLEETTGSISFYPSCLLNVDFSPDSHLRREYFFMVLSQQFCSFTFAYRPLKRRKTKSETLKGKKTPALLAATSFEGRVIQHVLDGIKKSVPSDLSLFIPDDFVCPLAPEPTLINQLFAKQLQLQDKINRLITNKRIAKVQHQKQKLLKTVKLKDECLSSVCQELRTPITHMKTALSLLNSPTLKISQRQRYLQMLNNECDRQNSLISGVLDLVELERNLEEMTLELVRLSDVVPGVVSTYQPIAQEKGIMLAYTVPTDLPSVWCVSGGLKQIVINLLSNSIKFTPNGGQVWVMGRLQGDYVQLDFKDTGIGIPESEISKIFERFYRLRSSATEDPGGVGLGLTIVQQLLRRSGGSIVVQSKPSEGSNFTIQLPTFYQKSVD
ncbi:ATP-binding protein [Aetokthonos hydrillicola Thurmond2011]|jgi:hypothetical protein|uniref:histidine kinase n=1 Tax=Aetokthonos hydrillicola Thurmond2011 TaxID=2712845 RepID=A0AAP5IET8_9CYAN|nr:DICT sensory domain-containing protein [Aetokthonos hydrillicola]MBO3461112.1 ATPase [Aetokthonos hydrillicola CCALA 1050]MBW4590666.1 ATPase [Aetokthonos hydrillicola CCALA 1050]MDR9897645.1 ATP-binding protein [Aetokthonos hydrillicola Thurmond2011]